MSRCGRRGARAFRDSSGSRAGAICVCKFNTGIGRQHAYWQLARWFGDLGVGRHPWVWRQRARHRRARHDRPAGRFAGRAVRRSLLTASTSRRGSAASSRSRRPTGKVVELKGPNGDAADQWPGDRLRPAGVVHLQGRGRQEALHGRDHASFRSAQSTKKPWNFYYWPTKADSIHEPWAGGNGRVDTMTDATATTS